MDELFMVQPNEIRLKVLFAIFLKEVYNSKVEA